jgi:hypothetical protein
MVYIRFGLVYKSHPGICTGINTGIANPISLVLIHLVPVQNQHTLIYILPKMVRGLTNQVLGFEYLSAYLCCAYKVAIYPGINLAMFMCFNLYPFSYFEFALKLFMSDVSCSLAEPSSTSLVFLFFLYASFYFAMAAIWFSYFNPNCLGYAQHGVDETLKI